MQSTHTILMIEPVAFRFNQETASNNFFQKDVHCSDSQALALEEFTNMVGLLRSKGVTVEVIRDTFDPHTPDSIFPNNWISFHGDIVVTYPMYAANRRLERRPEILADLEKHGYQIKKHIDYSPEEEFGIFLEGTGSMVLDRVKKVAYACISPRTNPTLLKRFSEDLGYSIIPFDARHPVNAVMQPIYHTNVMMAIGTHWCIICLESIADIEQRNYVIQSLESTGREIVNISFEQMNGFAGNMLEIVGARGELYICLSQTALSSLNENQINSLERYGCLLPFSIPTIETLGGGSVRCMMAELF